MSNKNTNLPVAKLKDKHQLSSTDLSYKRHARLHSPTVNYNIGSRQDTYLPFGPLSGGGWLTKQPTLVDKSNEIFNHTSGTIVSDQTKSVVALD